MGDILFLAHRIPWPPNRGDKIRSYNFLKKLLDVAPVHLACFADDKEEAVDQDPVKDKLASCEIMIREKPLWRAGAEALIARKPISLTSFEDGDFKEAVEQLLHTRDIDCIFVFSGQMAQYVPADFDGRFIMDFADVDSAKFESYSATELGPMAWINRREGRLLKAFEKQVGQLADQSLFVSDNEVGLFQERSGLGSDKVCSIGNGIDLEFYNQSVVQPIRKPTPGPLIVFTGQMDYRPNVEAVQSFVTEVFPNILADYSEACFAIVGRAPTDAVKKLQDRDGVIVTGGVPDIRQWLKAADIVVAPLRIARGIQNKVLEAMAMGKPVVASTAAAEGIAAENGKHFIVAASPQEEAQQVLKLMGDAPFAEKIGHGANQLIRSQYSWDNQLNDLPNICGHPEQQLLEAAE